MKKFLIALLAVVATTAHADVYEMRKRIICDARAEIFTRLAEDYEEQPVWMGHSPAQTTDLVLTANVKTGSWTLVEYTESWACVLAVGERSRIVRKETTV